MDIEKVFNEKVGHQTCSSIMNLNRVRFIKRMIIFDDSTTSNDRWEKDKFSAFGEVFKMFNKSCAKNYLPDDFLAIDETLYPNQGGIASKSYNKDKLVKYGLNFQSLGSTRNAYVYYTIPYCGKPEVITDPYIGDTLALAKRIVEVYEQNGYPLRGSNISMDQYYTSIPLAKWLYRKQITCIRTIQTNRKGLLKEIKEITGREKNSWIACKEEGGNVHLNSYVVKTKSTGMRNVLLLHTTEAAHDLTNDEKRKLYTYKIYDFTKGGFDLTDR